MKYKQLAFLLVLSSLLAIWAACGRHSHDHEEHEHSHDAGHGHSHDANAHMNTRSFEELVLAFEDPARDEWQRPDSVIAWLGELSGKTVADIGAGTGYFTFPLAEATEKVIAIDIDERFISYMEYQKDSLATEASQRIECRLADEDDPKLQPGETDIILIVNTYHHIGKRTDYFSRLKKALREDGRLIIIDYFKQALPMGPSVEMKLSAIAVADELADAGYGGIEINNSLLPYQYIVSAGLGE